MAGTITIRYCDIEKIPTDCMVNVANSGLRYGTGVCHSIFTGAGKSAMEEACRRIGHCDVGKAVLTEAFALPAKWVIHAVGPYTSQPNMAELLCSAYFSAMELLRGKGCHKVSFPLISSGAFNDMEIGYEPLWKTAISAIWDYQAKYPNYTIDVLFVCHGHQLIEVGKTVLASLPAAHAQDTESLAAHAGDDIKRFRVYVSPMGGFRNSANYEYIAEFATPKLAGDYVRFMRGKKRYSDKDIIVQEVAVKQTSNGEITTKGKVVGVLSVIGESLPVEEYVFQ